MEGVLEGFVGEEGVKREGMGGPVVAMFLSRTHLMGVFPVLLLHIFIL